jgi:hypothetical protein
MRRWNLLFVAALLVAVLITLSGPGAVMAAGASTTNFKGKAAVYSRTTDSYFVVSFTCSNRMLSGKWTYEVSSSQSVSGTLGDAPCELTSTSPWSTLPGTMDATPLIYQGEVVGTLTLVLSNIVATKTYIPDTANCSVSGPCILIRTSGFEVDGPPDEPDFSSTDPAPDYYGTLNLTLPKS